MKKVVSLILFMVLLCFGIAVASGSNEEYTLEPGMHEVGKDIPSGYYDIRIKGLDQYCIIRHSIDVNLDGTLNMDTFYSYELTFTANQNYWQGCHPNIMLMDGAYIEIVNSYCVLYPIDRSQY